jgi:hypothetical protein
MDRVPFFLWVIAATDDPFFGDVILLQRCPCFFTVAGGRQA